MRPRTLLYFIAARSPAVAQLQDTPCAQGEGSCPLAWPAQTREARAKAGPDPAGYTSSAARGQQPEMPIYAPCLVMRRAEAQVLKDNNTPYIDHGVEVLLCN